LTCTDAKYVIVLKGRLTGIRKPPNLNEPLNPNLKTDFYYSVVAG